jgi:GNAT superfamily N-acetyltransferase
MRVEEAGSGQIDALARLRALWRDEDLSEVYLTDFRSWFRRERPSRWFWLAADESEPIGMVNVKLFERMPSPDRPPSRWGYLANLFVVPDKRHHGVGTALVEAAVARARAEDLARLVLAPSESSVPLYRRQGFRPATDLLVLPLPLPSAV